MNKVMFHILRELDRNHQTLGSPDLARALLFRGVELSERTVRYYLKLLDEKGLTRVQGKRGRVITEKGKSELGNAFVSERVNFVISKIDSLAYLTDFNIDSMRGRLILNISFFPEKKFREALKIMAKVFESPYAMSNKTIIARSAEKIGDITVPEGYVGLGSVCSITLNGIFLKAGIPIHSRYGGVVEIVDGMPGRFTSLISYEGSSLDPLEIFIKSRMTDVTGAIRENSGKVLASFREIPVVSLAEAEALTKKMTEKGVGGKILYGKPNQPLLDIPVGVDKVGMIVAGGLNPVAAAEESGVYTKSMAMSTLYEYSSLRSFNEAVSNFLFQ